MKKWWLLAGAMLVLLLGYVVAGPWLAIRGIHQAIEQRELGRLERHVDFAALRASLRAQAEDRLARETEGLGNGLFGGIARGLVNQIGGTAVEGLVSPTGIALLLEGRSISRQLTGVGPDTDPQGQPAGYAPLKHAQTRFESTSRFVATTTDAQGSQMVFVFQRQGLRWRLIDIQLPPSSLPAGGA